MQLLVDSFNPAAAEGLMCRDTLSVGWDGRCVLGCNCPTRPPACAGQVGKVFQSTSAHMPLSLLPMMPVSNTYACSQPPPPCRIYDCDFNQQLELGLVNSKRRTVFDLDSLEELTGGCRDRDGCLGGIVWCRGRTGAGMHAVWQSDV
jgi:hypothetical protein